MKLSCVIPAHNEEGCIESTVQLLHQRLKEENIEHELRVINDNSNDRTGEILSTLQEMIPQLVVVNNTPPNGFGFAVRKGLETFDGDAVCIFMADASDSPDDVVKFFHRLNEGYDCVFGSRWSKGGYVEDYPFIKRVLNRIANYVISILFNIRYNDVTNAFKMYRDYTIQGLKPFLSPHFNLTVELPLKAIVRGYSYSVIPNSWINRKSGESKLKIKEMGSRYIFIMLYCLIEKYFSRGDFMKQNNKA